MCVCVCGSLVRVSQRREKSAVKEKMTTESNPHDNGLHLFAARLGAHIIYANINILYGSEEWEREWKRCPAERAFRCIGARVWLLLLLFYFLSLFFSPHTFHGSISHLSLFFSLCIFLSLSFSFFFSLFILYWFFAIVKYNPQPNLRSQRLVSFIFNLCYTASPARRCNNII